MRDPYGVADEADDFAHWKSTGERDIDPGSPYWAPWVELIRRTVGRGVAVRRARIVSEPVSTYIRYEHAATRVNVEAGEQVRWLPRRRASDIALPGNDFWLVDDRLVRPSARRRAGWAWRCRGRQAVALRKFRAWWQPRPRQGKWRPSR